MSLPPVRLHSLLALVCGLVVGAIDAPARADQPKPDAARALALNDLTGKAPIEAKIKELVADPAGTKRLLAEAAPLAAGKDQPFNYNAAYILAHAAAKLNDEKAAAAFFQVCLDQALQVRSNREYRDAATGLSEAFEQLLKAGKYDDCETLCQVQIETLERRGFRDLAIPVYRNRIRVWAKRGKSDEARKSLETLVKSQPEDWQNLELQGSLQREMGDYGGAAKTYERMIELIQKDPNLTDEQGKDEKAALISEIHYILSGVYVDLNQVDKAAEQLQILLKEHPDDPGYNNDLGYIWADHDMNLDQAETLIRKALDQDRKQRQKKEGGEAEGGAMNPAYLDSLGWVLYKQKKYDEAKPYLLQAVKEKEGQHVEIYDHLAEVCRALGDKAGAVSAWKKGVEAAGPSKREQQKKAEIERKLQKYP